MTGWSIRYCHHERWGNSINVKSPCGSVFFSQGKYELKLTLSLNYVIGQWSAVTFPDLHWLLLKRVNCYISLEPKL